MSNVLRKQLHRFEQLGIVRFENALNKRGSSTEFVLLNEDQTNLATMFARNSEEAADAKLQLTKDLSAYKTAAKLLWQENQQLRQQAAEAEKFFDATLRMMENIIARNGWLPSEETASLL